MINASQGDNGAASSSISNNNKAPEGPKLKRRTSIRMSRNASFTRAVFGSAESAWSITQDSKNNNSNNLNRSEQPVATCFRGKSLRTQLFLYFGITTTLCSIGFVVISSIVATHAAGNKVIHTGTSNMDDWGRDKIGAMAKLVADVATKKYQAIDGMMLLLSSITQDRFMGYPYSDILQHVSDTEWSSTRVNTDQHIPFENYLSKSDDDSDKYIYPLEAKNPLPLDWQIDVNVYPGLGEEQMTEHIRDRRYFYFNSYNNETVVLNGISTLDASFSFPGACDPDASSTSPLFYPGCTHESNDISGGGAGAGGGTPRTSPYLPLIHSKASDYSSPVLKALYEAHRDVKSISLHFFADAVSASVTFPGRAVNGTKTYTSQGCEWMLNTTNPRTGRPIATPEQVANCHDEGTVVSARDYNAFEDSHCRDAVLQNDKMSLPAPFYDQDGIWIFRWSRAIWDGRTHDLLACLSVDVEIHHHFESYKGLGTSDELSISFGLIQWDEEATLLNSSIWIPDGSNNASLFDYESSYGVNRALWDRFRREFMQTYEDKESFDTLMYIQSGWSISMYPYPLPQYSTLRPEEYRPEFMSIFCVEASERDRMIGEMVQQVTTKVSALTRVIVLLGCISMACIVLLVYVVSIYLTSPLKWMDKIGNQILASAGTLSTQPTKEALENDGLFRRPVKGGTSDNDQHQQRIDLQQQTKPWSYRLSPRTEITQLVDEFHKMVQQFSGKGTAKLFKEDLLELKNPFTLYEAFQKLYDHRKLYSNICYYNEHSNCTRASYASTSCSSDEEPTHICQDFLGDPHIDGIMETEHRLHRGPNVHLNSDDDTALNIFQEQESSQRSPLRSAIFWCIFVCVALPLIVTMVGISSYVLTEVSDELPAFVKDLEVSYTLLQRFFLRDFGRAYTSLATEIFASVTRDLYLYNRLAGWLLLGAIPPADTFTAMTTVAEQCKDYPFGKTCPSAPQASCQNRHTQRVYFEGLREDADLSTGDRNFTSFPEVGDSPNQTYFWESIETLPGFEKGYDTNGYGTTYDRLRATSALSTVQLPLFNYAKGTKLDRTTGSFLSFEADGMQAAYDGCSNEHVHSAHIQIVNDPSEWDISKLCPEGKYGLDSRCFSSRADAKRKAFQRCPLHLALPKYNSETQEMGSLQMFLPLIDVNTTNLIGLTSVDFSFQDLWEHLEAFTWGEGLFRFVVKSNDPGNDVILNLLDDPFDAGPPTTTARAGMRMADAVLAHDKCEIFEYGTGCRNLDAFQRARYRISGNFFGLSPIWRTGVDGEQELFDLNSADTPIKTMAPVDPSDFSRGARAEHIHFFSIVFGQTAQGIIDTFTDVAGEVNKSKEIALIVLIIGITLALVLVSVLAAKIAMSVSVPVAQLCALVTAINRSDNLLNAEFPEFGIATSYELERVRATFERLHMLVRAGNTFLFVGQLGRANETLHDAVVLFRKLQNTKAIGIANNNLGNVMLTMYRTMERTSGTEMYSMDQQKVIQKGCQYFKQTIDIGEEAIKRINDQEGWSENYLIFMQQLSNRYFNRAMFLLTVKDKHPNPSDAASQGRMDLQVSRDMDLEVVDNGDREGFKGEKDVYLELVLGRIKGNLLLMKMGYEDEWGVDELIEVARKTLLSAMKTPSHSILFNDLEPAGYMQRLDGAMIEYYLILANKKWDDELPLYPDDPPRLSRKEYIEKAAMIAVRMMFEDDYIIGDCALLALHALIELTRIPETTEKFFAADPSRLRASLFEYRQRVRDSISLSYEGKDTISREAFLAANLGDFSMEAF